MVMQLGECVTGSNHFFKLQRKEIEILSRRVDMPNRRRGAVIHQKSNLAKLSSDHLGEEEFSVTSFNFYEEDNKGRKVIPTSMGDIMASYFQDLFKSSNPVEHFKSLPRISQAMNTGNSRCEFLGQGFKCVRIRQVCSFFKRY
ncbi:hypothetical protein F2Q70_00022836 [Brassica cretica]|uniref:Uncharacterized protein n=1 Tax=Brassica cretica TaxID=69181 RepID=A0A3N6UGL5_BRACR|nr:hypothetical protein F2Q70_00022836 [Brassica cretica]KAF3581195.1 hypothetical protein DY000_02035203 [Brassica cretica]